MTSTIRCNHILASLAVLLTAVSASAQVPPYTTVLRISVAPRITDGTSNTIATLGRAKDGEIALIVRSFDRRTGFQQGSTFSNANFPPGVTPRDVLQSTVFEPGHALVLDSDRRVYLFPLGFMPDGTPFLDGSVRIIGPLGPPEAGEATVVGEGPNASFPDDPFVFVGTALGGILVGLGDGSAVRFALGDGSVRFAIQDLGAIPQVGYFAISAVSSGLLFLINPDGDPGQVGLQPMLAASLRDPRDVPLIDFGSRLLDRYSQPLDEPAPVRVAAANGTTVLAILESPPSPAKIDAFTVKVLEPLSQPVKQAVLGSLTWLAVDGSGVLYNAAFTLEEGFAGRAWTIAGASMEIAPDTHNLASGGRFVTVRIEAENNRAAEIDLTTLTLSVDGALGSVLPLAPPAPALLNFDGDLNVDLEVKFDRAAVIGLLGQTVGPAAIVRARWEYFDGTDGTASAQVSVKR